METPSLSATKRQELGSRASRRLRAEGMLPAVLYGHRRDTVHLTLPRKDFEHVFHHGARLVDLEIGGTVETAVIKELQYDMMGDQVVHVDFARVAMDEKLEVAVPVELHGLAIGTTHGGILDHVLVDLEVSCLPRDIPDVIRIEVAQLDVGGVIHVRDITPPPGVEFRQDPDAPVVMVHAPLHAEVAAAPAAAVEGEIEAAEPELIGRKEREAEEGDEE